MVLFRSISFMGFALLGGSVAIGRSALDSASLHLVHGLRPMQKGRECVALVQARCGTLSSFLRTAHCLRGHYTSIFLICIVHRGSENSVFFVKVEQFRRFGRGFGFGKRLWGGIWLPSGLVSCRMAAGLAGFCFLHTYEKIVLFLAFGCSVLFRRPGGVVCRPDGRSLAARRKRAGEPKA